jgi:chromosome segregation ATPase
MSLTAEEVTRIISEALAPVQNQLTTVIKNQDDLKAEVTKVQAEVTKVQAEVTKVQAEVTKVQAEVTKVQAEVADISQTQKEILEREEGRCSILLTQYQNRLKGPNQMLAKLRYDFNGAPLPPNLEQPRTFAHLTIGGKENVPNGTIEDNLAANKWTREKSKKFLKAVLSEATDEAESDSEDSRRARAQRHAVAEALGVPATTLQAFYTLPVSIA